VVYSRSGFTGGLVESGEAELYTLEDVLQYDGRHIRT